MPLAYVTLDEVNRSRAARKRIVLLMTLALVLLIAAGSQAQDTTEDDIRQSVVKVLAIQRWPHLLKPWSRQSPRPVLGSGAVIEGQRILTNAHLVMYSSQIYVQPYKSSNKFSAKVTALAPGIDLAVLKVEDETLFKGRPTLKMASGLPGVNDTVSVYGYPVPSGTLSTTKGVISRIEFGRYNFGESGLQIEVGAALNPGNSGGPAIVNGQMAGLVFGVSAPGQNLGYLVPNEEIRAFLRDVHGGICPGKQQMSEGVQALENDAIRAKLGLDQNTTGVLVRAPDCSESAYPLKKGDVITRIGSYDIDNTGMIHVGENLRLPFSYLVPKLAEEDNRIPLTVEREGKTKSIELPVGRREERSLFRYLKGDYPSYFVWGPLCFSPATGELVGALDPYLSAEWSARSSPLINRRDDDAAFEGEQLVIVTTMFPHKTSKGYTNPIGRVVSHVSSVRIRNLRHLVQILRDANDRYVEVEFAEKYVETLVFDRQEVLAATEDILADNGIRQPCSADLRDVWKPGK